MTDAGWDGTIAPGSSVSGIGFNANYNLSNAPPAAFYLNGAQCNGPTATTSPSAPQNLAATTASSSQINLTWTPSTTTGVTYNVYASASPGVTASAALRVASGVATPSFQHQGLTASTTYYYVVTAISAGTESSISNQASATTGGASCQVAYTNQNDWGTGFTGSISITNTDSAPIQSWTLTWVWPGSQQITGAWNASFAQNGTNATLTSLSSDATISPGATISGIGLNASYTDANTAPSMFYLNGVLCH